MDKEQRKAIRKFESWQQRKFAHNAKKGYRFFQPDGMAKPTPRSSRDAWGGTYMPQNQQDKSETIIKWVLIGMFMLYFIGIALT